MTTKADDLLRGSVRSGEVSGVVAMATASGSPPYVGAFGTRSTVNSSRMSPDTIFQVSGLLRPIMAVAGLQLVDSGVLGIDEPLRTIIPALNQPLVLTGFDRNGTPKLRPARGEITLRRVLNHTAGFNVGSWWDALADLECPWWAPPWAGAVSLLADPGSRWLHCSDTDLIAMIIERISGLTVAEYLHSEIFRELGMLDTGFEVGHRSRWPVAGANRTSTPDTPPSTPARRITSSLSRRCSGATSRCSRPSRSTCCAPTRSARWGCRVRSTSGRRVPQARSTSTRRSGCTRRSRASGAWDSW